MNARLLGLTVISIATLAGCGSSSDGMGVMNVRLVDAPGDFQQINLHVLKVEIHGTDGGWQTLGNPDTTVNLLSLQNGVVATLVNGATVHAGTYTQLRLVLGSGNTVMLADGTVHDLVVPSGLQSGVKLVVNFTVEPNTTKDVFIDFDGAHSIMLHEAGASQQFILRPVIQAFDKIVTGAILGKLTDATTAAGLPGVVVTAQTVDATGTAFIARSAVTATDGSYVLDLLPIGGTYYVVSQPVVGTTAYVARSSAGIAVTMAAPTPGYSASFAAATGAGGISGGITPATTADADIVSARQSLDAGGTPRTLIVRTTVPAVVSGVESYAMTTLPVGSYSVGVIRRTVDASGNETFASSTSVTAVVTAGGTATANLAF